MPLADRVWGYNQVSVLVSALRASLGCPAEWEAIPPICGAGFARGFKIDFVAGRGGIIRRIDHLHRMERLQSFLRFDLLPAVGSRLHQTVDCFTACGSVSLCHRSEAILQADMHRVREWEKSMWVLEDEDREEEEKKVDDADLDAPKIARRGPIATQGLMISGVGEEQAASAAAVDLQHGSS